MKKNICLFCNKLEEQFSKSRLKVYYKDEPKNYKLFCCNRHYVLWNNREIEKVTKLALDVIGKEGYKKWLYTKNEQLNDETPKKYLQDIRNRKKLFDILNKIKNGIPK